MHPAPINKSTAIKERYRDGTRSLLEVQRFDSYQAARDVGEGSRVGEWLGLLDRFKSHLKDGFSCNLLNIN